MDFDGTKAYLLSKPETVEDYPFGPEVTVFRVLGKIFAFLAETQGTARVSLKCDPDEALALRDIFSAVIPGYHLNKSHWNTVVLDGSVPQGELERMMDNSYALVVAGLPKAKRLALEIRHGAPKIDAKPQT